MEQQGAALDLPLITEATNEFYRQVYGNNDLGPIFKVSKSLRSHKQWAAPEFVGVPSQSRCSAHVSGRQHGRSQEACQLLYPAGKLSRCSG
jgi:truncated hemoglobin YjbI